MKDNGKMTGLIGKKSTLSWSRKHHFITTLYNDREEQV